MTQPNNLVQKQREYLFPCVGTYYQQPLVIERGEGMYVWDDQGNKYLDCFGGVLTVSVGHANPVVNNAIIEQVNKVAHTSTLYINQPQVELAEKVAHLTPGRLQKSFFTNSGTEADETAIVLARLYTGRQEIVALRHCYSGRSMLAMSVTAHSTWRHGGPYVPGIVHAAAPYCYRCPFKLTYPSCELACARDVEELIQTTTSGQIAGFIAEPILGVGGFITPPKEYFREVTAIIKRYGGIFICDEVQTGWGRTGDKWFGIEHWDVEPEIMTFAKGMANGAPIGATVATPEVAQAYPSLTFSTFGGNPVTMAAALATIRYMEEHDLPRNARIVGQYLRERLEELKAKYPVLGDVRGMGLMQGLELVKDRRTKEPHPQAVAQVFEITKQRGVLIGKGGLYGNVIRLGPPLIATKDHIDELIAALDAGLTAVA
ncbi:MAG: aspartate aminotransferase family protein [Acidobacteriota bacterium]|nr:aspartate aminotransferase family protein [Blastocatellia bacterium]MDW8238866.1 aspartate aminotransferase family protein [Acidobacteriota bacterium]